MPRARRSASPRRSFTPTSPSPPPPVPAVDLGRYAVPRREQHLVAGAEHHHSDLPWRRSRGAGARRAGSLQRRARDLRADRAPILRPGRRRARKSDPRRRTPGRAATRARRRGILARVDAALLFDRQRWRGPGARRATPGRAVAPGVRARQGATLSRHRATLRRHGRRVVGLARARPRPRRRRRQLNTRPENSPPIASSPLDYAARLRDEDRCTTPLIRAESAKRVVEGRTILPPHGFSSSLPITAPLSSRAWAWRASASGRRAWMRGLSVPAASISMSARMPARRSSTRSSQA